MRRTQISLTDEQHDVLSRVAKAKGVSMSTVLRHLLAEHLEDFFNSYVSATVSTFEELKSNLVNLYEASKEKRNRDLKKKGR